MRLRSDLKSWVRFPCTSAIFPSNYKTLQASHFAGAHMVPKMPQKRVHRCPLKNRVPPVWVGATCLGGCHLFGWWSP